MSVWIPWRKEKLPDEDPAVLATRESRLPDWTIWTRIVFSSLGEKVDCQIISRDRRGRRQERISKLVLPCGCPNVMPSNDERGSLRRGQHHVPNPDEEIPRLLEIVQRLRGEHPDAGFHAFTFKMEEYI